MDEKASKPCEGCVELATKVAELEAQLALIQDQLAKATKNSATSSTVARAVEARLSM